MGQGSVASHTIYTREIAKIALQNHAVNVILAHNHPANNPMPSKADIDTTKQIKKALKLIDIQLIDHFIVTQKEINSMANLGYL